MWRLHHQRKAPRRHRWRGWVIREQIVEAAQRKLEALSQYMGKAHTKAACALRSHPAYGRYIKQDEKGMLHIDTAKIASESLPSR